MAGRAWLESVGLTVGEVLVKHRQKFNIRHQGRNSVAVATEDWKRLQLQCIWPVASIHFYSDDGKR